MSYATIYASATDANFQSRCRAALWDVANRVVNGESGFPGSGQAFELRRQRTWSTRYECCAINPLSATGCWQCRCFAMERLRATQHPRPMVTSSIKSIASGPSSGGLGDVWQQAKRSLLTGQRSHFTLTTRPTFGSAPATAANSLIIGTPTDVQMDLTGVAATGGARESAKADLGAIRDVEYYVDACLQFESAPTDWRHRRFLLGFVSERDGGYRQLWRADRRGRCNHGHRWQPRTATVHRQSQRQERCR